MPKKSKSKNSSKKLSLTKSSSKKSLTELMKDEDGFVSKKTILKVGLSTVAALGVVGAGGITSADHTNHANVITQSGLCVNHQNITTHSSY